MGTTWCDYRRLSAGGKHTHAQVRHYRYNRHTGRVPVRPEMYGPFGQSGLAPTAVRGPYIHGQRGIIYRFKCSVWGRLLTYTGYHLIKHNPNPNPETPKKTQKTLY